MGIGDIYRLEVEYKILDTTFLGMTVHHYRQEGAIVEASSPLDLATAFLDDGIDNILANVGSGFTCSLLRVRGVTVPTEGTDLSFTAHTSPNSGEVYDLAAALHMEWRTGLVGRSYRGRSFFPPALEASVTSGGGLSAGYRGGAQVLFSNIINLPASAGHGEWQMGILSRFSDKVERVTPLFTPVTTGELQTYHGLLRQRRD